MSPFQIHHAKVKSRPGAFLSYWSIPGSVPTDTVYIHGNLSSNSWWLPTIDCVKKDTSLNKAGRLIFLELRGCGQSSDVGLNENVDVFDFVQDVEEALQDLKLSEFNLVGHSTGGSIIAALLTRSDLLIKKAVLISPVSHKGRRFSDSVLSAFEEIKYDSKLLDEVLRRTIGDFELPQALYASKIFPDAQRAALNVGLKIAKGFDSFDISKEISQIKIPVLIVHGDSDGVLPWVESKQMADLIHGSQFVLLKNTGHCPNLQCPKELWDLTRDFLF